MPGDNGETLTEQRFASHTDGVRDPSSRSQVAAADGLLRGAERLLKRRTELRQGSRERLDGPQGELRSELLSRVDLVPLELVHDDPKFKNVRLSVNLEKLDLLAESMNREGLKQPVVLVESGEVYHVRAGFRRVLAARKLRWSRVPAVILPRDTPEVTEHWVNIVENSARADLTTYEVSQAAKMMRDEYRVPAAEFAQRAGYSIGYVLNLLRCADRLPPEILEVWKSGAPIPVDMYVKWSTLGHSEAIGEMLKYTGRNPKVVLEWRPPPEARERHRETHPIKMASATGLSRMQRLRIAAETSRSITDAQREMCLLVIDFCSGSRDDVPGLYDAPKKKKKEDAEPTPLTIEQ